MSIIVNGTTLTGINVNGTALDKLIFNNITVFEKENIYDKVKNASTVSESDWLKFLNAGCVAQVISKGDQTAFISTSKVITISNSVTSSYSSWNIADFNHDNTTNTCDLIQCNTVYNSVFGNNQYYNNSTIRTWLTGTYYNGFSTDIRNKLVTMAVSSNYSTLNDKVKLLSADEVGITNAHAEYQYTVREGSRYSIFTAGGSGNYQTNSSRVRSGTYTYWWLRTRYTDNTGGVCFVRSDGRLVVDIYNGSSGVVPCIRFA